jgi:Zn finger protein HypA/HybF involved in hydrogenase expression
MFREQSAYIFECANCGAKIETHPPEGRCAKCGVAFRVERGSDKHASH